MAQSLELGPQSRQPFFVAPRSLAPKINDVEHKEAAECPHRDTVLHFGLTTDYKTQICNFFHSVVVVVVLAAQEAASVIFFVLHSFAHI